MRAFRRIALTLLAGLSLAACAGRSAAPGMPTLAPTPGVQASHEQPVALAQIVTPTPTPTPASPSVAPRPDIVVWWPVELLRGPAPAVDEGLSARFDAFQEDHSLTLLVRTKRSEGAGGIMSTLRTASRVAPDALPDLALMTRANMRLAVEDGLLYPLESLLPATLTGSLYRQARALGEVDDALYGVAYTLETQHVAYRQATFQEPPTTFEAVLQAGQPFAFPAGDERGVGDTLLIQYVAAGGRVASEDGSPLLEEAPLLAVLTFYQQAVEAGLLGPDVLDYRSAADYWDLFLSGALGLAQVDSTTYLAASGQVPNVAAAPVPTQGGQPLTTLRGWLWVLTTPDPDRQARAVEFLTWMMEEENHAAFARLLGRLPAQPAALRAWQRGAYGRLTGQLLEGQALILAGEVNPTVAASLQAALLAVLNGQQTAQQAAAEAVAAVQ